MRNLFLKKALIFLFTTLFFSLFSFQARNYLISSYNNTNFLLFHVDYVKNYGAAFSLFSTHTSFLAFVSLIILFLTIYLIFSNISKLNYVNLFYSSILCSGIICNLSERLTDGFVTDYIRLNFIAFPIFNISDMFICIGAFMIICNILFNNEND